MPLSNEALIRTIGNSKEILEGLQSGLYRIWGGVIRITEGNDGAGRIVAHLKFPADTQQTSDALEKLRKTLGEGFSSVQDSLGGLQSSMDTLQAMQSANLALSGLNLAVSVAGFVIVCQKLNNISAKIDGIAHKLDELLELVKDTNQRQVFFDVARFKAAIKSAQQFSEMGDIQQLKPLVKNFQEQYEFTKLLLESSASSVAYKNLSEKLECHRVLQERFMYLGFFLSFVQKEIGADKYAVAALNDLESDWLSINTHFVETIAANDAFIESLKKDEAPKIISMLNYRKTAAPVIEYQKNLLELSINRPDLAEEIFNDDSGEILLIAA